MAKGAPKKEVRPRAPYIQDRKRKEINGCNKAKKRRERRQHPKPADVVCVC
jgi:hypothetical protein